MPITDKWNAFLTKNLEDMNDDEAAYAKAHAKELAEQIMDKRGLSADVKALIGQEIAEASLAQLRARRRTQADD